MIAAFANGDARTALNTLEMAVTNADITPEGMVVTRKVWPSVSAASLCFMTKTGKSITI